MFRGVFMTALAAVLSCGAATAAAQSPSFYTVDPYDVRPQPGMSPAMSSPTLWQLDPFGIGYNMLSGYRPVYGGARQPIGHEIIATHPNGNGYVYRPVYAPSSGYHYSYGGTLIIENPRLTPESRATESNAAAGAISQPMYLPAPPVPMMPAPRRGPREF